MLAVFAFVYSCTKIDSTTLGADLLPVVDNINTFESILDIHASNVIPDDSTRIFANDLHVVGGIDIDPLFGESRSSLFYEMKPSFYPFLITTDSIIKFDSAVMVLSYAGYYGDSASPVSFKLYETTTPVNRDTAPTPFYTFQPNLAPNFSKFLGQKIMEPRWFRDTVAIKRGDSVVRKVTNQLRIRLDQAYAEALFFQDTADGAFKSDSLFDAAYKGFALVPEGAANALMYFNLNTEVSRIEFYFRSKRKGVDQIDTTQAGFGFTGLCGHAIKFDRNRTGAEINQHLNPDPIKGNENIYIQSAPGTYALLKIPGIDTLTNRVIHRAEIRVTELEANTNPLVSQLTPSPVLFLDVADTANTFKGVPYDMTPFTNYFCFPNQTIEYFYFGGQTRFEQVNGENLAVYRLNITRHLQSILTRKEPKFNFRLSTPYYLYYRNCANPNGLFPTNYFILRNGLNEVANLPGRGRLRVAGGNHPDPKKRMQLRIIYSKL